MRERAAISGSRRPSPTPLARPHIASPDFLLPVSQIRLRVLRSYAAGSDPDAPRRLYYVAMTRVRHTLTLASLDGSHGFQAELVDHAATVRREVAELRPCQEAVYHRHVRPTLEDVDLGFAGRRRVGDPMHRAIAAVSIGDPLGVRVTKNGRWQLLDSDGRTVGRLAKSFRPPSGTRCRSAKAFAVVGWSREASDLKYRDVMRCDAWEMVMPELVFEPDR